jgi:IPT/TIG domain-containing protein
VIDSNAGIIYVVARTKASNSTYHFFLHALDIKSGNEQLGGPVEITGQVTGSGPGSSGGVLAFNPVFHLQRPSLLLMNGVVYVAFGAVGDIGTFHGWIMGYDATTLLQTTIFCVTPNGSDGGIWQAGQGLVADGLNNIYVMTGNGTFDANVAGKDYGDSVLKISTSSGLAVSDYFTPSNQANLFAHDTDLGSGGPLLLPGTSLVVGIGKDKLLRLVDSTNMGKFNSGFDGDVQEFTATLNAYLGSPVYWDSPNNGPVVYLWSPADLLTAYKLVGGMFQTTPATQSTVRNSTGFANTVPLSVSANGGLVGSGIVWAGAPSANASSVSAPGVLRAFDATNLGTELWDSMQNPARDDVGLYAKWVPRTVANGKVYLPSFSGQLLVYGLNPPPASGVRFVQAASATPGTATASVSAAYSSAQAAGDLNVVIVSWTDATSTIQSVTDAMGNTYSLAIGPTTGTGLRQSVYYLKNIAAGTNSVTVAFNQAASSPDVRILEYSGVDTVSPLDVSVGASGSTGVADSGSVVLGNANDLIIGANIVSTKNIVAGSPFTSRLLTSTTSNIVEDRVVNVAASYDAWAPLLSAGPWVMQMVAFKAGSAITNPAPTVSLIAPTSGPTAGGTPLAITGTGFLPGATVSLGGTAATGVVVASATSITATSPSHAAGAVDVVVTNTDGQTGTLSSGYTYTGANPAPTVTLIAPNTGSTAGGTRVTITGTGFLPNATVTLGGTAATGVVVVSPTSITATTPAHAAGAVDVVVTNTDGQSSLPLTNGYTYTVPNPAPTVSTILPTSGPTTGGTPVTITGTGFSRMPR